jgi:hypothetical protein
MTAVLPSTEQLAAVVRRVPGVCAVYPAGPILATALNAALDAVTQRAPTMPMVLIEQRADGVRITAKIGIAATESCGDVCARVHDVIAAHLLQSGNPPVAQIAVIVASIG